MRAFVLVRPVVSGGARGTAVSVGELQQRGFSSASTDGRDGILERLHAIAAKPDADVLPYWNDDDVSVS